MSGTYSARSDAEQREAQSQYTIKHQYLWYVKPSGLYPITYKFARVLDTKFTSATLFSILVYFIFPRQIQKQYDLGTSLHQRIFIHWIMWARISVYFMNQRDG